MKEIFSSTLDFSALRYLERLRKIFEGKAIFHIFYDEGIVGGFSEVINSIGKIYLSFVNALRKIIEVKPYIFLPSDSPDFNIPLSFFARKISRKMIYFIPPQVWAWRERRKKIIAKLFDAVIVILPFEKEIFESEGIETHFFGHPICEILPKIPKSEMRRKLVLGDGKYIAFLPGSRESEISRHLDFLIFMEKNSPYPIVVPTNSCKVRNIKKDYVFPPSLSHYVLGACDFAILSSGTATLESFLLGTPTVAFYKLSPITFQIAKRIVRTKYISLPNIILQREVVPEFIQNFDYKEVLEKALAIEDISPHSQYLWNVISRENTFLNIANFILCYV